MNDNYARNETKLTRLYIYAVIVNVLIIITLVIFTIAILHRN